MQRRSFLQALGGVMGAILGAKGIPAFPAAVPAEIADRWDDEEQTDDWGASEDDEEESTSITSDSSSSSESSSSSCSYMSSTSL